MSLEQIIEIIRNRSNELKIRMDAADWKENDHPREKNGRFAPKGGGESGGSTPAKSPAKSSGSGSKSSGSGSGGKGSSSGSTGSSSGSVQVPGADKKGKPYNAPKTVKPENQYKPKKSEAEIEKIGKGLKNGFGKTKTDEHDGDDSLLKHTDKNGNLTPERDAIHKDIICEHLEGVKKPSGKRVMTFMGGGSASGKSSILYDPEKNPNGVKVPSRKNGDGVLVDSDEIKKMLPEYKEMDADGNDRAAGYCHEESSALTKRIMQTGIENGYNVTLDGTGDGKLKSMREKIQQAKDAGMEVRGVYCTCDIEQALERNWKRGKKTGRLPGADIVVGTHKAVSAIFPEIYKDFDHLELWDTNDRGKKVKIAEAHGGKLTVHDQAAYDKFLKKKDWDGEVPEKFTHL